MYTWRTGIHQPPQAEMQRMKATRVMQGYYLYRGYHVYKVGNEWYIKQEGETYASDVLDTKRQAMDMIDCYESFNR